MNRLGYETVQIIARISQFYMGISRDQKILFGTFGIESVGKAMTVDLSTEVYMWRSNYYYVLWCNKYELRCARRKTLTTEVAT